MGINIIVALSTFTTSVLFMYLTVSSVPKGMTRYKEMMEKQQNFFEGIAMVFSLFSLFLYFFPLTNHFITGNTLYYLAV